MINSMTGYGRSTGYIGDFSITLDFRSVNHKYSEISIKLPKALFPLERKLKEMIQNGFSRGRFDLSITINGGEESQKEVFLDKKLAKQYYARFLELKKNLKIPGHFNLESLLSLKDVVVVKSVSLESHHFEKKLLHLLKKAISLVNSMRQKEGRAMAVQMQMGLKKIRKGISRIEKRVPKVLLEHKSRLMGKIKQFSGLDSLNEERLLQEVAYFAERSDIDEELNRLKSHLVQFDSFLEKKEPSGRSLEFIIQEMNREANTMGSKGNDSFISREVIEIKGELERLREQSQNVE